MNFKIGDKIRVVNASHESTIRVIGKVGTIRKIPNNTNLIANTSLVGFGRLVGCFYNSQLEKVSRCIPVDMDVKTYRYYS